MLLDRRANSLFANRRIEPWLANEWDMVIIQMKSCIFFNERGASSVYPLLLRKADVLDASEQEHYSHGAIKRIVGGSIPNNLKSATSRTGSKRPFAKVWVA